MNLKGNTQELIIPLLQVGDLIHWENNEVLLLLKSPTLYKSNKEMTLTCIGKEQNIKTITFHLGSFYYTVNIIRNGKKIWDNIEMICSYGKMTDSVYKTYGKQDDRK